MGTVYLARDPDLDRLVAIKVLRDPLFDQELLERFFREARAAAKLRHENLITIYDVGQHDHQPFMAMEYVDGTTLASVIAERQPLPLAEKLSYIEQICSGLHHAHCEGIIHRDVKPANLRAMPKSRMRITRRRSSISAAASCGSSSASTQARPRNRVRVRAREP
jgi:serine/threonine-protein kinase